MRKVFLPFTLLLMTVMVALAVAAPAAASEKGKIHILFMEPFPAHVKMAQNAIDEFKKDNPGVEFNLEPLGFGNFMAKVSALKAAGNPPDLIYTIPGHMWNFQKEDWLAPVDDVYRGPGRRRLFPETAPATSSTKAIIGAFPRPPIPCTWNTAKICSRKKGSSILPAPGTNCWPRPRP